MENSYGGSYLYNKAKNNKEWEKPKGSIKSKVIKNYKVEKNKNEDTADVEGSRNNDNDNDNDNDKINTTSNVVLPNINPNKNIPVNFSTKKTITKTNTNFTTKPNAKYTATRPNITSKATKLKKNFKEYLKENILKTIQFYLDPKSIKNFMLTCKRFNKTVNENDELWYILYTKKFLTKKTKYEANRSKWKIIFLSALQSIYKTNYSSLKTKFLSKINQNAYAVNKDPYFISNQLYSHLKPLYYMEVDGKPYPIKHIFSNKILSHINFFANFDREFIDLNKVKSIKLILSEKNLGIVNCCIQNYEIKKKKFEELIENTSKICRIYYDSELILSTFEKNLIFFFNISIPICKICESIPLFDFLKGMHGKNLDYFDDVDKNFGLYDYVLLINIKSWNNIFYTVNVNTLDFKRDGQDWLIYEFDGKIVSSQMPYFEIKTVALNERITNLLILDITMLSYKGDHIICDSFPLILKRDEERITLDQFDCNFYCGEVVTKDYQIFAYFKYSNEMSFFCLDKVEVKVQTKFIERIFKK